MATDSLSTTFAALADPTRRAILARLATGQCSVTELAEPFDMSLPAISKHLRVLETAGLITRGREAQWRPCRIDAPPIKDVAAWAERYRAIWEERFDRLDTYLQRTQIARKQEKPWPPAPSQIAGRFTVTTPSDREIQHDASFRRAARARIRGDDASPSTSGSGGAGSATATPCRSATSIFGRAESGDSSTERPKGEPRRVLRRVSRDRRTAAHGVHRDLRSRFRTRVVVTTVLTEEHGKTRITLTARVSVARGSRHGAHPREWSAAPRSATTASRRWRSALEEKLEGRIGSQKFELLLRTSHFSAGCSPILRPAAESLINWASRRARVSSRFALVTQWIATRRYQGGCARRTRQPSGSRGAPFLRGPTALRPARARTSRRPSSRGVRAANARRPAGRIRPSS